MGAATVPDTGDRREHRNGNGHRRHWWRIESWSDLRNLVLLVGAVLAMSGYAYTQVSRIPERLTKVESVNALQDTAVAEIGRDIDAVLNIVCRQTRRTDPEWLPARCDRVLSRQR